jgi:hypothetical protein
MMQLDRALGSHRRGTFPIDLAQSRTGQETLYRAAEQSHGVVREILDWIGLTGSGRYKTPHKIEALDGGNSL